MTQQVFTGQMAAWIRRSRKRLGMTQLHLAMAIGVRRSTVASWERGSRTVSALQYIRLSAAFKSGGQRVERA